MEMEKNVILFNETVSLQFCTMSVELQYLCTSVMTIQVKTSYLRFPEDLTKKVSMWRVNEGNDAGTQL